MTQSLALSSSTQNSEKLNQAGFNPPPRSYRSSLLTVQWLPQLLQHFEMQVGGKFRHLWWVQDGAPAHRLRAVTAGLRELFSNRVIALHRCSGVATSFA